MFVGHWAPALVAATHPKSPKIGTLFVAAQLIDWAFFGLLLVGAERMRITPGVSVMNPMDLYYMPFTHSLLGCAVWAAAFALLLWLGTRDSFAAIIGGTVVLSHWLLDLLVHVPDLTLAGSPPKLGFGLWNYPAIEMPLELGIVAVALWLYVRARRPAVSRVVVLAVILLGLQLFNWFAPPPPEVTAATSLLGFVAYGVATLAAWWMGKSARTPAHLG